MSHSSRLSTNTLLSSAIIALSAAVPAFAQSHVSVERRSAGLWRATYHLERPVTRLTFERPAAYFRERSWRILTPGYHLRRIADEQSIVVDSAARARKEIVVEYSEFAETLPKEYEFFQRFSNGDVTFYTAHLYATAWHQDSTSERVRSLDLTLPRRLHAILNGRRYVDRVSFNDGSGEGTYIFVGVLTPLETADVLAIVDPSMPTWLAAQFARDVPRIFAAYRTAFGRPLSTKPTVFYSFHDTTSSGTSSGGGTLDALVNMVLTGNAWKTQTPAAAEQAVYLIAHEAAHLWNGQLVRNRDATNGSWMHEGGADAVANEVMHRIGAIDSVRFLARQTEALNRCAGAVALGSVETALPRGAIKAVYDCGFVMALWTAAVDHTGDVFAMWRALLRDSSVTTGGYDQQQFFSSVRNAGVSDTVIAAMRTFLAGGDKMYIAVQGLREAGMNVVVRDGPPPASVQRDLARAAVVHLMAQSCGRVSVTWGRPVKTAALASCAPFSEEHSVYSVNGHDLVDDGAAAYDSIRASCDAKQVVRLESAEQVEVARVPCSKPLRARPPYYEVLGRAERR